MCWAFTQYVRHTLWDYTPLCVYVSLCLCMHTCMYIQHMYVHTIEHVFIPVHLQTEMVLYSVGQNRCVMRVSCGGGHRSYGFSSLPEVGQGQKRRRGGGGSVVNYPDFLFFIVSFSSQRRPPWCTSRGRSSVSEWLTFRHTSPHLCCRYTPHTEGCTCPYTSPLTILSQTSHIHTYILIASICRQGSSVSSNSTQQL